MIGLDRDAGGVGVSSIGDSTYRRIRADIIFGRLQPGQKLKLDTLRDSYEASVSTLREILSRLASEGFVVAEGQRGFEVTPVSVENLREVAAACVRLLDKPSSKLEDLLEHVEAELRMRRFASALRIQVAPDPSPRILSFLLEELELQEEDVYTRPGPLAPYLEAGIGVHLLSHTSGMPAKRRTMRTRAPRGWVGRLKASRSMRSAARELSLKT